MSETIEISRTHPEYDALSQWWAEGLDFYRGGIHVLQPGREIGKVGFMQAASTPVPAPAGLATDSEARPAEAAAEYKPTGVYSYLWSHERENKNRYDDRQKRLGHFPVFQPVIDIHADAIMRTGVRINDDRSLAGPWSAIVADADQRRTSLSILCRDALAWGMAQGRMHALVDFPRLTRTPSTRAEEREWGLRPWISLVTPLDIVNWALDAAGDFAWAVIREPAPDKREPGQPANRTGNPYWFRLWTPNTWTLFGFEPKRRGSPKWGVVEEGWHGIGRVPIATLRTDKDPAKTMYTQSPFAAVQRIDRVVLNLLSLLHEIDYGQTFTTWFFPDPERTSTGAVEMGINNALTGPAAPVPLSPDEAMAAGLMERIKAHIHLARVAAGASRGQAEESIEARSAAAYVFESEQKRHQMARLAESTEQFVNDCLSLCGAWLGVSSDEVPRATLPRNFDLKSLAQKINEALTLDKLNVGPKAMGLIKRNLASQMERELGAAPDEVAEMLSAIDEWSAKLVERAEADPSEAGKAAFRLDATPAMGPEDGARVRDEAQEQI